jgi:hypothetical protein
MGLHDSDLGDLPRDRWTGVFPAGVGGAPDPGKPGAAAEPVEQGSRRCGACWSSRSSCRPP